MKWKRFQSTALALLIIMLLCVSSAVFAEDYPVPSPGDEDTWDDDLSWEEQYDYWAHYPLEGLEMTSITREVIRGYFYGIEISPGTTYKISVSLVEGIEANWDILIDDDREVEELSPVIGVKQLVVNAAGEAAFEFRPPTGKFFNLDAGYLLLIEETVETTGWVGGASGLTVPIGKGYYYDGSGNSDDGSSGGDSSGDGDNSGNDGASWSEGINFSNGKGAPVTSITGTTQSVAVNFVIAANGAVDTTAQDSNATATLTTTSGDPITNAVPARIVNGVGSAVFTPDDLLDSARGASGFTPGSYKVRVVSPNFGAQTLDVKVADGSGGGGGGGCEAGMGGAAVVFAGLFLAAKRKRGYPAK
ncbi:MAG: hypothetical protein LBT08_09020 [Synergistaceae bacterium]|jgi:hypothetical protein|nr:hypothetical protein [Synergistaceae bacterium]